MTEQRRAEDALRRTSVLLTAVAERDLRVMAGGAAVTEEEALSVAGQARTYLATKAPYQDAAGRVAGVVGVSRDITDRKRAEDEVRRSERRVRAILESVTDGFFAVDRDWRFTYVNGEAERMRGRTRDALLGRHIWEEVEPAVGTPFHEHSTRAMREGAAVGFEAFYPPLDRWFEVRAYPPADGLAVYFRDATERRQSEERVRLAGRLEAVGRLAGGVAHDFHNLLTVINRCAELLLAGRPPGTRSGRWRRRCGGPGGGPPGSRTSYWRSAASRSCGGGCWT